MKAAFRLLPFALWITVCAGEEKNYSPDFAAVPEGDPPGEIFVVDGVVRIASHEGKKMLSITGEKPEVDSGVVLGPSAAGSAKITARIFASKAGRTQPKFGIGVHGQTGFRLLVFPAKKELQLVKNDEVIASTPYDWKSASWITLQLEARRTSADQWLVTGAIWSDGVQPPEKPQISHRASALSTHGQCSLWGLPLSGTPVYFDAVRCAVEN